MTAAPLRVLVVDDEPPIRKLLRMGLTAKAIRCWRRRTARPRSSCSAESPDLIILDLGLPDTQGLDLLRSDPRPQ